jgi:hypothetical protein
MATNARTVSTSDCCHYRICVGGMLDARWVAWFENTSFSYDGQNTTLHTSCVDQAALYGLIARLRNLGLTLLSVSHDMESTA